MEPNIEDVVRKAERGEILHSLEISSKTDPNLQSTLAEKEYAYGKTGLIAGGICILIGAILCFMGVVGTTNWTAKAVGFESNISDAAPGVFLFVVGVFIIFITKPNVRHK